MEKRTTDRIKRIVLIGPESTGKTDLAVFLSNRFNTVFVPEYARNYISNLTRKYNYKDVQHIAKRQIALEIEYSKKAKNGILFYDTYLIITKVWFKVAFNKVPDWMNSAIKKSDIGLFLLCNTDLPWVADDVRENGGEMREKLFEIYKSELDSYGLNYKIVRGESQIRFDNALNLVNNFLQATS